MDIPPGLPRTQRLSGGLTIDQRSESEAVMVFWLIAGEEASFASILADHVVIGCGHL
ncbi:hypothetical protein FHS83_003671 [Rhizomicrobium palustre]|uniref:Uncharacterized protein n=1 Tax=Rhizomicrobium palustre TaxID=189966 RepID=A0A846N406_9PROT|nr:hypothetical protein [Rhizomicrobium palustre]NIK90353.1 hypothetical protein [Rhizomicrobium palustre]